MSLDFVTDLYLRVMTKEDLMKGAANESLPPPGSILKWMLRNREDDLARTKASIDFHITLLKRKEEEIKAKKPKKDGDNNGSSGFGGASGMVV